jgi:nucleoside triphosphate pyrophosphatase
MVLWLKPESLVLASKSEIRHQILVASGIPVEVRPAAIDERSIERDAGLASAADVARLLAAAKAKAVGEAMPGRLVLGADQTLGFNGRIFSKPADRAAARAQLGQLRGSAHELHSAIAVVQDRDVLFEHVSSAQLTMRAFSDAFLERYLDTVGPAALQSVGSYQLEAAGIHLFERIDGDHFTILGLPLLPLLRFLRTQEFVDA